MIHEPTFTVLERRSSVVPRVVALVSILVFGSCSNRSPEPPPEQVEPPPTLQPTPALEPVPDPVPELARVDPEPEPPPDPFPGRTTVSVGELLEVLSQQVAVLAESPEVQRDYQQFLIDWRVPDDPEIYLDYVRVRLAFETTRAGGLWGVTWQITNELPQSDRVWAQWRALELADDATVLPEVTAIAECDELSALFAFVVHRIGLSKRSEVGLLWPVSNHTVAVWTIDRKSDNPIRIVVPTSQIYLGKTQSLGTGEFNPWKQKTIFDYKRKDAALKLELPAALARRFVRAVQDHGGRSQGDLQTMRNEREKRQWGLR